MIEESGGDPLSTSSSGKYQGLLHWGPNRYRIKSEDFEKELSNQLRYLRESLNDTTDHKSWTDGGDNSGYDSFRDTYSRFHNESLPLDTIFRAFSFGYVRPAGKQGTYIRRNKVVHQVFDILNNAEGQ